MARLDDTHVARYNQIKFDQTIGGLNESEKLLYR